MNTKTPPPHEAICMQNGVLRESHRYKDIRLYVLWDLVRKTILNGGWSVVPSVGYTNSFLKNLMKDSNIYKVKSNYVIER